MPDSRRSRTLAVYPRPECVALPTRRTHVRLATVVDRLQPFDQIIEQIDRRLFTLPADTIVLPGHGLDTTIANERPHLDEWIERRW